MLIYSYQEIYHKKSEFTYKKSTKPEVIFHFFIQISSIENLLKKKSELMHHYYTIIRPKQHRSPGFVFDKVKLSFAGPKLHPFFTLTNGLV